MAHDHDHGDDRHGHGHSHDHGDLDWAALAPHLEAEAELYTPLYERALAWLGKKQTEPGLVVDAGSGPGVISALLAEAFPGARVVAVDAAQPLLERALDRAEKRGVADRFSVLAGELPGVLDDLEYPADLIWASNSLHHLGDQRAGLTALAARLAPGGTLAVLEGGLPVRFLPRDTGIGRPGFQDRLDVARADWFAEMRAALPGAVDVPEDWPDLLAAAGLRPTGTRSFLLDVPPPATDRARACLVSTLTRVREACADRLDATDTATLDRLLDPDDRASLHHRRDVFFLTARTVHTATRIDAPPR
ncbi:class I SAM-dependent methyltransferase [Streptomyces sp. NPDC006997]|uniref:class I SAM-dependent methyltransferase n=1 Tax=Streptomyces sp. NPDC006997 TaxID=3155356 RepID=UPI0033D986ED